MEYNSQDLAQTYLLKGLNIAVVGARGAVGYEILSLLDSYAIKINTLVMFGGRNGAGKVIKYQDRKYTIELLNEMSFKKYKFHIAFFSAGAKVSKQFAPLAAQSGALVIDNTSHFRMDEDVPLIVPEVNPQVVSGYKKSNIIANPNCSTIQMLHVLKPLDELYEIEHVNVTTYQAVSGAGIGGVKELMDQIELCAASKNSSASKTKIEVFPHQIAMNVIPSIDVPLPSGFTKEEEKMIHESRKILDSNIQISPTCVRVPILRSHSESISIRFNPKSIVDIDAIRNHLDAVQHIKVLDDFTSDVYPTPLVSTNTDYTYVGRIRKDMFDDNVVHLFCCADQLRVGAATNAVKIALLWLSTIHNLNIYPKQI